MNTALRSAGSIAVGLTLLLSPLAAYAVEGGEGDVQLETLCSDGIDNNDNGLADAQDPECAPYYRILSVVNQIVGTTTAASNFTFTVSGVNVPSLGTFAFEADGENNFLATPVGQYTVIEASALGFTTTYDNCGTGTAGDNDLTLPVGGVEETCTITNTWIVTTPTTPTTTEATSTEATSTPPTGGSDTTEPEGSSSRSGGSHRHSSSGSSSGGEVLGESTCGPLLTSYVREGEGSADVVTTLQNFLAKELGIELPTTGVYDVATKEAVNQFQLKYWEEVLAPWVGHGLASDHTATGYVYKTTLHKLNKLFCASLETPTPVLP